MKIFIYFSDFVFFIKIKLSCATALCDQFKSNIRPRNQIAYNSVILVYLLFNFSFAYSVFMKI